VAAVTAATDPGASVFLVRWVGVADFTASTQSGHAPLLVSFQESSTVPAPSAWHWEFGDGSSSDEQNPVHAYAQEGVYDVRLTVTGAAGQVVRQKPALVTVTGAVRSLERLPDNRPPVRTLEPRP